MMSLVDTTKYKNQASKQDRGKTIMIFLRHYLNQELKIKYLIVMDSPMIWNNLKDRYDHLKMIVLPLT